MTKTCKVRLFGICISNAELYPYWLGTGDFEFTINPNMSSYSLTHCGGESIVVPEYYNGFPVTVIGERVAYNFYFLKSIVLPNTLQEIGKEAFHGTGLTQISIPDTVVKIGESAFASTWIEKLFLPAGLKEIEPKAFSTNELKEVHLPDGLTKIGREAFAYAQSLQYIYIPSTISYIARDAFMYCSSLVLIFNMAQDEFDKINFEDNWNSANSDVYVNDEGSIISTEDFIFIYQSGQFAVVKCISDKEKVVVPSFVMAPSGTYSVTTISRNSFANNPFVKKVVISEGIVELRGKSFSSGGLREIVLPQSLRIIGDEAFGYNPQLNSIIIPKGVVSVGRMIFNGYDHSNVFSIFLEAEAETYGFNSSWNFANGDLDVFYYSNTFKDGFWRYVNGVPTKWSY